MKKKLHYLPPIETTTWWYEQPMSFNNPASRWEYQIFVYDPTSWFSERKRCLFPMKHNDIPVVLFDMRDASKIYL